MTMTVNDSFAPYVYFKQTSSGVWIMEQTDQYLQPVLARDKPLGQ